MAGELEAAGYLIREKRQGAGGKWIWNIEFNPEPPDAPASTAIAGFSSSGCADSGEPVRGSAGAGGSGHKGLPRKEIPTSVNTTTTTNTLKEVGCGGDEARCGPEHTERGRSDLVFPPQLSPLEIAAIAELLGHLANSEAQRAQELLDELADAIENKAIRTTPLRWFRAVLKKFDDGSFVPLGAVRIKERRELQAQERLEELRRTEIPRSDPRVARPALDVIKRIAQQNRGRGHA